MPKDASVNPVVDVLLKARELISDRARWCQGALAKTKDGKPVSANNPRAVQWCALGAMWRSSRTVGMSKVAAETVLANCAAKAFPGYGVVEVNDHLGHDAALRVFDVAIVAAAAK